MNHNNETARYAGGRLRDVLDPWREMLFSCPHCGRETLGKDLEAQEIHDTFFCCDCPACGDGVVSIDRPHVTELMANLASLPPETAAEVRSFAEECAHWRKAMLHSVAQLPEIATDPIVLIWDTDRNGHEHTDQFSQIVIRCGEREIYRGPPGWEYYEYFIDACKVLRRKYGDRLHDVIPTRSAFNAMCGDKRNAPEIVREMRKLIRDASRIGNWMHLPLDPLHSWETYRA